MSEPTGELDYQIEKRGGVTIPWLFHHDRADHLDGPRRAICQTDKLLLAFDVFLIQAPCHARECAPDSGRCTWLPTSRPRRAALPHVGILRKPEPLNEASRGRVHNVPHPDTTSPKPGPHNAADHALCGSWQQPAGI
jgi:hypothetical protein